MVLGGLTIKGTIRLAVYAITLLVAGRYIAWRVVHTVPHEGGLGVILPGYLLVIAELYAFWLLLVSIFMLLDPIRRPVVSLAEYPNAQKPGVDVLIATFNEPPEIIKLTLLAAKNLSYPDDRLNIVLLDDGGTTARLKNDPDNARRERSHEIRTLCEQLGVQYQTRSTNDNAKAGNLSHGMEQTDGEYIAVLDCDHMPTGDFLDKTLPYLLDDANVWLVQSPHAFLTPDPLDRNMGTHHHTPDENEMFYGAIQQGLDRWDVSFFCGSAALIRRASIEEAGGFQGTSITEDAETSVAMHARGWRSVYVSEPLIAGLQPETVSSYIYQRQRWLKGMLQIFLWRNPVFTSGLTFAQRIGYLGIQTYWFFPLARAIFVLAPLWFLFTGHVFYLASPHEFFAYTLPFLLSILIYTNIIFGRLRRPLASEVYENALTPYLLPVLISTLFRPGRSQFNVTAKDESVDAEHLSPMAKPLIAGVFLSIAAIAFGLSRALTTPQGESAIYLVLGFVVLHLLIMLVGLGAMVETPGANARKLNIAEPVRWTVADGHDEPLTGELGEVTTENQANLTCEVERSPAPGEKVYLTSARIDRWLPCEIQAIQRHKGAITLSLRHQPEGFADQRAWLTLLLGNNEALSRAFSERRRRRALPIVAYTTVIHALIAPIRAIRAVTHRSRIRARSGDLDKRPMQEES